MTEKSAAIEIDEFIPHPVERVWQVLTDPAAIARWLMENDFRPEPGHEFTMQAPPIPAVDFDGVVHCRVTALEPPCLLRYSWSGGQLRSQVSYRLEESARDGAAGTLLHFEHGGFDLSNPFDRMGYEAMGAGWRDNVLPGLCRLLDEQVAAPRP